MLMDFWLVRDGPAEGYSVIMDCQGLTMSHMAKVNIAAMRRNLYYVQVIINSLLIPKIKVICSIT